MRIGSLRPMDEFNFKPIGVDATAPGGARVLIDFDDIAGFLSIVVNVPDKGSDHWYAVRRNLPHARFGAREAEVHEAMRTALQTEGWLVC
jgi:hypothetical protein